MLAAHGALMAGGVPGRVSGLHFDGANNSTSFIDVTGRRWIARGSAKISTDQYVFGGSSCRVDGTSGCYVETRNTADFRFDDRSFCVRGWVYPIGNGVIVGSWRGLSATLCSWIVQRASNKLAFTYGIGASNVNVSSLGNLDANAWSYFEVTRVGTSLYLLINGSLDSTHSISGALNYFEAEPVVVGAVSVTTTAGGVAHGNAFVDDLEIFNGIAGHTSNYTVPSAPFVP